MKLIKTKESVIVQHILDLNSRGFPPQLAAVKDMADLLLTTRNQDPVGINQASSFIKHTPKLKVKFNQKYNYKRAKYKDLEVIKPQFKLIHNTKAKYSITNKDSYNFNKSGFIMGVILTGTVIIGSKRENRPKQVQLGNYKQTTVI